MLCSLCYGQRAQYGKHEEYKSNYRTYKYQICNTSPLTLACWQRVGDKCTDKSAYRCENQREDKCPAKTDFTSSTEYADKYSKERTA